MTTVDLVEHAPARRVPLPDGAGRALAASKIVDAAPDPYEPGLWRLRARSKVGAVVVDVPGDEPVTLRVTPKVPIARLFFLLGYSLDPRGWLDGEVEADEHEELLPALAHAVERQTDRALRRGLLQGYRATEQTAFVVRGRIKEAEQIRRRFGAALPVEVAYDEFTTDIAENRILRAAVERLLRLPGVPRAVRARLMHQRARLADAAPLVRGQAIPEWRPNRLNARYHRALQLARIVLDGASAEHLPGGIRMNGFLFDMNKVFEDFVCVALNNALAPYGGRGVLQAKNVHLDEEAAVRMRPDFVWYGESGVPAAVADAKYKVGTPEGYPDADLYQMLAYCTALGLREGHLVYAKGSAPHAGHHVRRSGVMLHQHAVSMGAPSAVLLAEIRALAERMAGSRRHAGA
ncbi:restriction endonuclease [Streptomyces sp. CB02923]|uniref:McrC family protein n=1 Tax=Streptomyces sp. CB02923 TaxID=1718985 RepID=UPI0009400529|nr:restriction endonuclease [Streptomyces sp. CB02923]OKI08112.1 restriction endonuclease [Streptomyces sp. CB02923]